MCVCVYHTGEKVGWDEEGQGWVSGETIAIRKLKIQTLKEQCKAVSVFFILKSNKNSLQYFSFSGAATMYTRYKIVEKQNQTSYFSTPVFNLVSLVLGLVGCIGMGIVANFQV